MENNQQVSESQKMPEPKPEKEKKERKPRKPAPVLMPMGEMKSVDLRFKVSQSSTEWQQLKQDDLFTLDTEASVLYVKKSVSSAINLNAGKSTRVSGAAVYRVFR